MNLYSNNDQTMHLVRQFEEKLARIQSTDPHLGKGC